MQNCNVLRFLLSVFCYTQTIMLHDGEVKPRGTDVSGPGSQLPGLWQQPVHIMRRPHSCSLSCPPLLLLCSAAQLVLSNRPLPSPDNCPPKIHSLVCVVSKHNFVHHVCPPEKQPQQEVRKMVPHSVHNRPAFFTVPQCAHLNKQPKEGVEEGRGTDGKEGEEKQLGSRITWQTPSKTVVRRDTAKKADEALIYLILENVCEVNQLSQNISRIDIKPQLHIFGLDLGHGEGSACFLSVCKKSVFQGGAFVLRSYLTLIRVQPFSAD